MKIFVIISEYNPFHSGHGYMISELKERFPGAFVVSLLSDPFTERGEPALFPSDVRGAAAVECGADLVLSLPAPYCVSGGAYYASAGVRAAGELFPSATLAFGSECGSLDELEKASVRLSSEDFMRLLSARDRSESQAVATERIYREKYGDADAEIIKTPNNILGIEYLSAIRRCGVSLEAYTLKRRGSGYSSTDANAQFPSAKALRSAFMRGEYGAFYEGIPAPAAKIYEQAIKCGRYSLGFEKIGSAVLAFFRLAPDRTFGDVAELAGGLGGRLAKAAETAASVEEFFALAETKGYTNARIRRGVISAMLGIREEDLRTAPDTLRLLAATRRGTALLKEAHRDRIRIVERPSELSDDRRSSLLYRRSMALYDLTLEKPGGALDFMRSSPAIF